jgi:hypothetical protein
MIVAAKQVETGFSLSTGKTVTTAAKKKESSKEMEALTTQIQQLSLNYATLANAFVAQSETPRNNNNNKGFRPQGQRRGSSRPRPDITCYNCGKNGHFAKNCRSQRTNNNSNNRGGFGRGNTNRGRGRGRRQPQTRFVLPTNHTRSLNHFDIYEENYEEYDEYDENDDEEYEVDAYVATRATIREGRDAYTPYHHKQSESQKEKQLQYPTMPRKPKTVLHPAPIEDPKAFEICKYLSEMPSGLTVGQAAYAIPSYRRGLMMASKRTRERLPVQDTYFTESEDEIVKPNQHTTAMQCELMVGKEPVTVIIDSGAATSIITQKLMKKLGHKISAPSRIVVVTTNGTKVKPLGVIKDFPITINHMRIPTHVEVLESPENLLLLGNDWLIHAGAKLDWLSLKFTIRYKGRKETVQATCHANAEDFTSVRKVIPDDSYEINEDECEDNEWRETHTYFSNTDEDEREPPNNPAIYLAQNERINDQNKEWNLNKDLHVGPLDQDQHESFQQLLLDNGDVYAKNQMDIGRTAILKHTINTGNAKPLAKTFYEVNPVKKTFINNEVQEMLKKGIIRLSVSPWAAPVVIVHKKDGT